MGKALTKPYAIIGTHEISQLILAHNPQNLHHIQFILYIFRNAPHFFKRNHGNATFPYKVRKVFTQEHKKELIQLVNVIARLANITDRS